MISTFSSYLLNIDNNFYTNWNLSRRFSSVSFYISVSFFKKLATTSGKAMLYGAFSSVSLPFKMYKQAGTYKFFMSSSLI